LDDVDYVAGLAHLRLDPAAKAAMQRDLESILQYMETLNELDTSDVEPMMHVLPLSNVFRQDVVSASLDRDTALALAPKTDGAFFLVPRILDTE
jgi:aspartyl-tRNA(Asn)/glutamyl-tRNA(Gln) amidotransferase subunit C